MGKKVNLCAKVAINTWANYSESNIWASRMPIYGQQHSNIWAKSQIHGLTECPYMVNSVQIIYGQKVKYMGKRNAHTWSTELQIYGQNSNTWANRIYAHILIIWASRLKYIHGQTNVHYYVYCGQQTFK